MARAKSKKQTTSEKATPKTTVSTKVVTRKTNITKRDKVENAIHTAENIAKTFPEMKSLTRPYVKRLNYYLEVMEQVEEFNL